MRKFLIFFFLSISSYIAYSGDSFFYGGVSGKYTKINMFSKNKKNTYYISYLTGIVEVGIKENIFFSFKTGISNYSTESSIMFLNLPLSVEKKSEGISNYMLGGEMVIFSYNKNGLAFGGVFSVDYYTGEEKSYEFQLKSFSGEIKIKSKFLNAKTGLIFELRKNSLLIRFKGVYSFLDTEFKAEESIYDIEGEDTVKFYPENDIIIGVIMKYTVKNFMRITFSSEFLQAFSVGMGVEYVF